MRCKGSVKYPCPHDDTDGAAAQARPRPSAT
nr:MAG TPA: hypothetical protein [Caudoviricetes sp.]